MPARVEGGRGRTPSWLGWSGLIFWMGDGEQPHAHCNTTGCPVDPGGVDPHARLRTRIYVVQYAWCKMRGLNMWCNRRGVS
eukprot:3073166-Pyramimonas_sp.AAC.1